MGIGYWLVMMVVSGDWFMITGLIACYAEDNPYSVPRG